MILTFRNLCHLKSLRRACPTPNRRRLLHRQVMVSSNNEAIATNQHPEHGNEAFGASPPNVLDVSPLAEKMRLETKRYTKQHKHVKLVGILAGEGDFREDAEMYSGRISETFCDDGLDYELVRCPVSDRSVVEQTIRTLNNRADVHGILVFYPIFRGKQAHVPKTYLNKLNGTYYKTDDDYLRDIVHPSKDVEGLCQNYNARHLFRARAKGRLENEIYLPCTALAVTKILEAYHKPLDVWAKSNKPPHQQTSSTITIINRSEILGRPLAAMLALKGARVYSVDENSILEFQGGRMRRCTGLSLETCLERSSIVVTGVPCPRFRLPVQAIQDGTTVVNVSEFCNVDEADFRERHDVTLIPQVGKVTVAALQHNLIRLHRASETRKQWLT